MAGAEAVFSPIVEAGGTATATLKVTNGLDTWSVEQVSTEMPSAPVGATCYLRKNTYPVTPMIGAGDTAGGDPPLELRPGDEMTVEWAGCTPGAIGRVFVIYDDGRGD